MIHLQWAVNRQPGPCPGNRREIKHFAKLMSTLYQNNAKQQIEQKNTHTQTRAKTARSFFYFLCVFKWMQWQMPTPALNLWQLITFISIMNWKLYKNNIWNIARISSYILHVLEIVIMSHVFWPRSKFLGPRSWVQGLGSRVLVQRSWV